LGSVEPFEVGKALMDEKGIWDSDRRLMRRIAGGNPKAFEKLYRATAGKSYF